MQRFSEGDRVRVDIPDETDPEHDTYHGTYGTVTGTIEDHAADITGDERDTVIFRVQLESGETMDFRWRDLRPP
jgi:ribosomal protein L21E